MTRDVRLGLVTAIVAIGSCLFVFSGGVERATRPGGEHIDATFTSTARLAKGMPVRVDGAVVGHVDRLRLDPGGRSTTVTMVLSDDALPLYGDARAHLRWRTALGGNYAVEVERGTRSAGRLAAPMITAANTTSQVEVDEILADIRDRERRGLKTLLRELAAALADPQQPADALATLARTSPGLARGLSAVRGHRRGDLTRLVTNTASTAAALADPDGVTDFVEGGAGTVAVTSRRSEEIGQSIQSSAEVLPRVRATLARIDSTLEIADPLIAQLRNAAPGVVPAISRLRPVVAEADGLLDDASPLVRSLRPAARSLATAARDARPLVDELKPILARTEETILADLAKPDPVTGRATFQMIGPTVASLNAASAGFDKVSHFVALTPGGGERALDTLPCKTYFVQPGSKELLACQTLDEFLQGFPRLAQRPTSRGRP